MSELTLISDFSLDTTSLSNIYIDEYMSANNESQIKIYLYLLRNLSKGASVSVITIADTFNYSVTDVERALIYMEKQGLMTLKMEGESIAGLRLLPLKKKSPSENFRLIETPVQAMDMQAKKEVVKPEYSAAELADFSKSEEIAELLFVAQQYIGKPATAADIKSIMFMNKELSFSTELIDYLIEQCVENGKKSFRYIEKVAISWYENDVTTVAEAKALNSDVPKEVYDVFEAFSIKAGSRKPTLKETGFVKKWTREFLFDMTVISKACEITLNNTHSISFEYADAVLSDWNKKGARNMADVDKILAERENKKNSTGSGSSAAPAGKGQTKAGGFSGRKYNFAELEKKLLSN